LEDEARSVIGKAVHRFDHKDNLVVASRARETLQLLPLSGS
jgi:hypothetical protein